MSSGKNIWQAAATGDAIALQHCLQRKSNKNKRIKLGSFRDNHNWTLLHHAVASGSTECVELLISRTNIDVAARCFEGRTAFFLACLKNAPIEILELLLANNSALVNVSNNENITPLHVAVELKNLQMVELLVINGALVNAKDYAGETPLHSAVGFGSVEILIYLIYVARADVSICTENDFDTLSLLAARGNYDVKTKIACFKILFNYVNTNQQYQQKYLLKDIYAIAVISYRSTSLIPHFIETALLWEKNPDKCRLARELLDGPNDQYITSQFGDDVNRNLYQLLALLLVYDEGVCLMQNDCMNYEIMYSQRLVQNEMVALSVAAIHENDCGKKLRIFQQYLDFVKHLTYFFSDHLDETLERIKCALMNDEAVHSETMTARVFAHYELIVNKIIEIMSIRADPVLLMMASSSKDYHLEKKFFEPILGFCTDLFMNERWLTPANLEKVVYPKMIIEYGTLTMAQRCEGFKFEHFSLLRQARDKVREAVWYAIDEDEQRRDLIFVRRLEVLEIPQNLIRYLRYR
ncbi:putative ankyrin repeat protein RF_0381 isoform X2 [Malaya genurostris]|nr:putative ankyrin repeat protein RF_0381 isoform X2 [Malaya genurostris]